MEASQLANQALQIENKVIETTGKIIENLIDFLTQECDDVKDKAVLGTFQKHIATGRKLMACPINDERLDEFAKTAQEIGLTYFVIPEKTNPAVKTVVYMDREEIVMKEIIERMTLNGKPLVDDMQVTLEALIANLGDSGLDETGILKNAEELAMFKVSANKNRLPFAVRMNERGEYLALTATRDAEKLRAIDGFLGMTTRHFTEQKDIKSFVTKQNEEKTEQQPQKENTSGFRFKKKGRGK